MGPIIMEQFARVRGAARQYVVSSLGGEMDAGRIRNGEGPGWFGPQSAAWKIHQDPCLLIGGIAALFCQVLHPLAMAGVAEHSSYETDPFGRLHRTSMFLAEVVYGDSAAAERNVETVRRIHERVRGLAPDGRPYSASDPDLLRYVHITEVAGFLRSYQRYGKQKLEAGEADAYVREMSVVAEKLGAVDVPKTVAGLEECLVRYRPYLALGEQGLRAIKFLRNPPGGVATKLGYRIVLDGAAALIDEPEASMLGLGRERRRGGVLTSGTVAAGLLREILGESPVVSAAKQRVGL